jgi:hypothetical protein
MMLVAPMNLLNISLDALLAGLGIHLGKVYTAHLIPAYSSGPLSLFIILILTSLFRIAIYYVPKGLKSVESQPIQRFANLLAQNVEIEGPTANPRRRTKPIHQSSHVRSRTGVSYRVNSADASSPANAASETLPEAPTISSSDEAGLSTQLNASGF